MRICDWMSDVCSSDLNPHWTAAKLEAGIETLFEGHGLDFNVSWHRSGEPFFTPEGRLRSTAREVLSKFAGGEPEESTGGGTSDARFIAPLGAQCIEVGPVNASIHKVDAHVGVADLEALPDRYPALRSAEKTSERQPLMRI